MKCLVVFIFVVVGLCEANYLTCQIFDQDSKSLEQYCNSFNGTVPANCGREIYQIESSKVEKLKIRGCDPDLVLNTAKPLTNLRVLDISYSSYKDLDWLNLTFNRLQIFNASHNKLSECSNFSFNKTPEVVEIDLSYNDLDREALPYFVGLNKLEKLHLSNNFIAYELFETDFDAINLEYIDLRDNRLSWIPILATSKKLKEMHLEGNHLNYFSCNRIGRQLHPSLKAVHLSWRLMHFIGDSETRCEGTRLRVVQNSADDGVLITTNGTYEMHCKGKCFDNIMTLRAGRESFENITEVLLQMISSDILEMDLSRNFLGELRSNSFARFIELKELNLSHTNIGEIKSGYVNEMIEFLNPTLQKLDVSGNMVGELTATTFQRLSNLEYLNLRNTSLALPKTNPFETLHNLKSLDLSQNHKLEDVNFSTFSNILYNLSELRLSDCRIKNISEVIQYLGPSIRKIHLSENAGNVEQTLHERTFEMFGNLNELNLRNTNLMNLGTNLFAHQPRLYVLDMSHNELESLDLDMYPSGGFYKRELNLEWNKITELKTTHEIGSGTYYLKLANNQISCSYLKQISNTRNMILLGNSWQQKGGRDCRSSTQSVKDFLSNAYEKVKFW